jgi:diaminopimelate epimerase
MRALRFAKYQGLGNDFLVVDARTTGSLITESAAKRLCDRRRGVGGDGVITLLPEANRTARMHIYNSDGSVPEMCGNGLRCVVCFLGGSGVYELETGGGLRSGSIAGLDRARVTLAAASVIEESIAVTLGEEKREAIGISMGNPHLVLRPFGVSVDLRALAEKYGPALERHPKFPQRVNVGFPSIIGPRAIRLVVFERGAGITDACGTGAGAAAFAMRRWGLVESTGALTVELPGGPLEVEIDARGEVTITGEAKKVFEGEVELADDELFDYAAQR